MGRPRTLTIPLQGGLGNQLFQLSAGIAAARRLARPVRFTDFWLRHPGRHETRRAFALDGLIRPGELSHAWAPRLPGVTSRFPRLRVVEGAADADALAQVLPTTRAVSGYFQRLDIVREAWPELRSRLADSSKVEHRETVTPTSADVGTLHYRLGDYLHHLGTRNAHGVTSPSYFVDEIRRSVESQGPTRWRVVSDDPVKAAELLTVAGMPDSATLEPSTGGDEWADLGILASARICLLSNSSFSWWAGFLGTETHGMQVVAPRPWFADPATAEPPFFPVGWERRQRQLMDGAGG